MDKNLNSSTNISTITVQPLVLISFYIYNIKVEHYLLKKKYIKIYLNKIINLHKVDDAVILFFVPRSPFPLSNAINTSNCVTKDMSKNNIDIPLLYVYSLKYIMILSIN